MTCNGLRIAAVTCKALLITAVTITPVMCPSDRTDRAEIADVDLI